MSDSLYDLLLLIPAVLIAVGLVIVMWRIVVGPNSMDRMLGLDGFIAIMQCALAVLIAWTLESTIVNAMLVVALLGFVSSLSVARFRRKDDTK